MRQRCKRSKLSSAVSRSRGGAAELFCFQASRLTANCMSKEIAIFAIILFAFERIVVYK